MLLSPVCAVPAFRHGEREWQIDGERVGYLDAMRYMQWSNVLGGPAAVVPVGQAAVEGSAEGLPIGVQLAGRPYEDELVLAVADVVDHAFGYTPPPMARRENLERTRRRGSRKSSLERNDFCSLCFRSFPHI